MDDYTIRHLQDLYGLNPNIPHLAFQFPRLPPGLTHPMFKIYENPMKEQFSQQASTINQKLQGFQHMYQQHASELLSMNSTIIPPGHPLYSKENSVETLQAENEKLLKENSELKKKLDKNTASKQH
ncbi:MAG: bZIP transcription factor [Nitrosopumilus sp.]